MDLATLEQNLVDALTQVISEEAQLQAAIDAVKAALPPQPPAPAPDPAWQAVQTALEDNGWTAPQPPAPAAPVEPSA